MLKQFPPQAVSRVPMKLQFSFRSNSVCGGARQELLECLAGEVAIEGCFEVADENDSFEFGVEVCCQTQQRPASLEKVIAAACKISSRFSVVWAVGHQHEFHLGFIRDGEVEPELREGLSTSLHIAHSFGGMIVDDELIELVEDSTLDGGEGGSVFPRAEEANWNELLDTEDDFTPFPKWDDGEC